MLLGNKMDMEDDRCVETKDGQRLADVSSITGQHEQNNLSFFIL